MKSGRSLRELLSFPGFMAAATLKGVFGDSKTRIVILRRRKKRLCVPLRSPLPQPLRPARMPCP
ncbi:hypothetical protein [Pseudofulvimonas gallinarii]|uniref:hypothetical protein n=1 Tax=Pseudofulvimonas gallinarii TaxID=634155 RepID=UPI0013DE6C9D|nr:hypothetical protein [Pseudofulvimonas gallinarii]